MSMSLEMLLCAMSNEREVSVLVKSRDDMFMSECPHRNKEELSQ